MARPFRIGATGGLGLFVASRANHPTSETGRAVFNVRLEGLGRRRIATSRDSKSDRTRQHSRSYSGPAIKRWTLREVSMNWGSMAAAGGVRLRTQRERLRRLKPVQTRITINRTKAAPREVSQGSSALRPLPMAWLMILCSDRPLWRSWNPRGHASAELLHLPGASYGSRARDRRPWTILQA